MSDYEPNRTFYFLNKDIIVGKFEIIGQNATESIHILSIEPSLFPSWILEIGLDRFIISRRAPKSRENIRQLLKESGCDTIFGYLSVTHALTLTDTFWVKPVDSALTWNEMSLYSNEFNEIVAKTAFEGGLYGGHLATTSPEYGTDGTYAKCWIREDNQIKMQKRGSSGFRNAGLEPYSEYYASQVLSALKIPSVTYDLRITNGRISSICDLFTTEKYGFVPYAALDQKSGTTIMDVITTYKKFGLENFVKDMFVADAVILNEDRHKGNFGFMVDNDTNTIVGAAPLFDHNVSMLCYAEQEDFENLDHYLSMKGPRIGDDFIAIARDLLSKDMRKKLVELKGFRFNRSGRYHLPDWRLDALEKVIQRQIAFILKNS